VNDYTFSHHSDFRSRFENNNISQEENDISKLLAMIADTSLFEIYIFDSVKFGFLYINKSAEENLGYSLDEIKHVTPLDIYTKMSFSRFKFFLKPLYNTNNAFIKVEIILQRKDFSFYNAQVIIKKITANNHDYFVAVITDITTQVKLQTKLKSLATTDSLTGICNRYKMNQILDDEIMRQNRYYNSFALLMLDIDYFKIVNDTYGHDVGDYVLQEMSKIILKSIRKSDEFARWGGEEFMVILPQTSTKNAIEFSKKLNILIASHRFKYISNITVSIGLFTFIKNDTKVKLLKRVDEALYEAKNSGRNKVIFKRKVV